VQIHLCGGEFKMTTRRMTLACLASLVLVTLSGQAFSATVAVGSCTALVNFATIQQAINAVPAGSTIDICPGTYHEQLLITQKVSLIGIVNGMQDRVVVAPPTAGLVANTVDVDNPSLPIAAQILVQNTAGPVSISNLTVDGAGNLIAGCAPDLQGILFQSASGTLNHVAVRNQTLGAGLGGCQSGEGIYVQTATGMTSTVLVESSSVHNYNKNGITGNDAGTTLTVTGSYVQGNGVVPSGGAAQNGIQLGFGAAGKISANTVIDNIYGDITVAASADVLLFDAAESAGITVTMNTLGNSQIPIGLYTDTPGVGDGVSVTTNKIFGTSTYDAIDVCTNGNTVKTNTIFNSAESGVHFDASCGSTGNSNVVSGNTVVESACAGILVDPGTSGNTSTPNTYYTVAYTITGSTSHCTIPAGPVGAAVIKGTGRGKAAYRFSPAK
jgi:hypothetical protein